MRPDGRKFLSLMSNFGIVRYLFILAIALVAYACNLSVVGNGTVASRTVSVGEFDEIEVSGAFEIFIRQSNSCGLEIELDENLFQYLDIDDGGGELDISSDRTIRKAEARNLYITVRDLEKIQINGANELETRGGIRGKNLEVEANGASEMRLEFYGERLRIKANGGSELRFKGEVDDLEIEVNGASEIESLEMLALRADVDVSGAAEVKLWVEDQLDVSANGASEVEYRGNPKISKNTYGASSVNQIDR